MELLRLVHVASLNSLLPSGAPEESAPTPDTGLPAALPDKPHLLVRKEVRLPSLPGLAAQRCMRYGPCSSPPAMLLAALKPGLACSMPSCAHLLVRKEMSPGGGDGNVALPGLVVQPQSSCAWPWIALPAC